MPYITWIHWDAGEPFIPSSPDQTPGVFSASAQAYLGINTNTGYTALGKMGKRIIYNQNLTLVSKDASGTEQIVGIANWSNYTAGDDGIW